MRLLSLSEPEAARLMLRAERDPLYEKLRPFIRRQPFPMRRFGFPLGEAVGGLQASADIPWAEHQEEMRVIQRIGQQAFERYFLHEESGLPAPEIASRCGISTEEARAVQALLFHLSLHPGQPGPAPLPASPNVCVARVEPDAKELQLVWLVPHLARGRYRIDYDGIRSFQESRDLGRPERLRLRRLLATLELINVRQNTLWRVLEAVLRGQESFFRSGRRSELRPMTASALARELGLHPSTVGRAVRGRSVRAPWSEELPLSMLLPSRRDKSVYAVRELLEEGGASKTDEALRRELHARYRLDLSRRTVNECRRAASKA